MEPIRKTMQQPKTNGRLGKMPGTRGFSLIELVIVVVIIGIIGAIAIPRLSRGAAGASDSAIKADLAVLRNAIELYAAEHGQTYPTAAKLATLGGSGTENALLDYSDAAGGLNATKDATHIYGPYLRALPPLPVDASAAGGAPKGSIGIGASATAVYTPPGSMGTQAVGWVYDASTGNIVPNTGTLADDAGTKYTDY